MFFDQKIVAEKKELSSACESSVEAILSEFSEVCANVEHSEEEERRNVQRH